MTNGGEKGTRDPDPRWEDINRGLEDKVKREEWYVHETKRNKKERKKKKREMSISVFDVPKVSG